MAVQWTLAPLLMWGAAPEIEPQETQVDQPLSESSNTLRLLCRQFGVCAVLLGRLTVMIVTIYGNSDFDLFISRLFFLSLSRRSCAGYR